MASYKINANEFLTLAQHYFLLAYQECRSELGMGYLQARTDLSVGDVLKYCAKQEYSTKIKYNGDYIAGRMAKLGIEYDTELSTVSVSDREPTADYQAWSAGQFKTFDALLRQAAKNAYVSLSPAT
jgi:hypothetical protein